MPERISIKQVYQEVKAIRRILEELSEKGILQSLATEPITEMESKELDETLAEVERGEFLPLRKVKRD